MYMIPGRGRFYSGRSYLRKKTKDVVGYCPHCGKPLKIGEKLCSYCKNDPNMAKEKDRVVPMKEKDCPKCKNLNAFDSVICSSCGINFVQYEMSKPLDLSGMSSLRKRKRQQ